MQQMKVKRDQTWNLPSLLTAMFISFDFFPCKPQSAVGLETITIRLLKLPEVRNTPVLQIAFCFLIIDGNQFRQMFTGP